MRPVNLIPVEERHGSAAALRAGATAYLLVAVMAVALIAVTASVLTSNQISDKEAELASLEEQERAAAARAQALAPYAEFAALASAREQTVRSLAKSRFDWERVLNELALVMPQDVWFDLSCGDREPGGPGRGWRHGRGASRDPGAGPGAHGLRDRPGRGRRFPRRPARHRRRHQGGPRELRARGFRGLR